MNDSTFRAKKTQLKRYAEMMANPYDRSHGTPTGYKYGCRCYDCCFAESERMRKYYKRHKKRCREYSAKYYREHRDEINARRRRQAYEAAVKRWSAC